MNQRFQVAHDLLEPLVIRLTLLNSLVLDKHELDDFLEMELVLYSLKPGLFWVTKEDLAAKSELLHTWLKRFSRQGMAEPARRKLERLTERRQQFAELLLHERNPGAPRVILAYNRVLEAFVNFREAFLPKAPPVGGAQ